MGASVPDLNAALSDPRTSPSDRLEAARRLVVRQSPEARQALRQAVTSPANPAARLSALRALADDPSPDPALLDPLLQIVQDETDERVVAPAAVAVAGYRSNSRVVDVLARAASATTRPQPLRSAAVRGLGLLIDPTAAAALVRIATNPNEPAQLASDAADALVEMTGLEANGRDPAKWAAWQAQNGSLPAADWKAMVADSRASRDQRLRRHFDELVDELQPVFEEQYTSTPPEKMNDRLLKFLGGATPEVRRVGARIANKLSKGGFNAPPPTPDIQARLEDLVGDADPGVRLDAVLALETFNLGERSLAAIRQQLQVESDSRVKAAMARTLAKVPGLAQLAELNRLLDDPSPLVVREAADAIRRRAPLIQKDATLQKGTVEKLRATIRRVAKQPAFAEAGRMCAEALALLKDPLTVDFARELLGSSDLDLRGAGLALYGELGAAATEPNERRQMASIIVSAMQREAGQQNPASVHLRKAGMDALARAGEFHSSFSGWLYDQTNPGYEPNAEVRNAARATYRTLLAAATTDKLESELSATGPLKADVAMRVEARKVLVDKYLKQQKLEDAATQQVTLGQEYMTLGRPEAAAVSRQEALNAFLLRNDGPGVLVPIVGGLTDSLLKSQQYAKLPAMWQNLFSRINEQDRGRYQQAVGYRIRNEAQQLQESQGPNKQKDWENAGKLIDAVSRMDPPLAKAYLDDLRATSAKLQEQQRAATRPAGRR
jgi:HEAT repeat protein